MNEETVILTELPEKPTGWTRRMELHLNYGSAGGAATYSIFDDKGRRTNIGYAYDTRDGGEFGFFVHGGALMPWAELRARYAELIRPASTQGERNGAAE